jgi:broad specificity phosphatase PhoE
LTRFLLIRHAAIDGLGKRVAGRAADPLNSLGRGQASRLAQRLARQPIEAIYSSPQRRALQTAEPLARNSGTQLQTADGLDEVDFGDWTAKSYTELDSLPEWRTFNLLHGCVRIPNGEMLVEVQARVVAFMEWLRRHHAEKTVALVSHADVIRVAIAHNLGIPIDFILRFVISPASVTAIELHAHGPRVLWINRSEESIDDAA